MDFKTLASGVVSAVAQTEVNLSLELARTKTGIVQVDGITSAKVLIQGRLDSGLGWVTIATFTADGAKAVTIFPEMRSDVDTYGSGTINVRLGV